MATESKDSTAADSPVLAGMKFRLAGLIEKRKTIDDHPETKDHDLAEAKRRNEMLIKELQAEIKRLEKK